VLLVPGLILYFMTPEERLRLLRRLEELLRRSRALAGKRSATVDPFYAALRARRRWPVVAYALVAVNAAVFIAMLFGGDGFSTPDALVAWGGNFGPQTAGPERWRVLTSVFVHRGMIHLLVSVAVLVQLGLLLERIVGPFTFATVYVASGVIGSVMSTVAAPMGVFVGASGALFGLYGLLLVAVFRGLIQSTAVHIPLRVVATLAPTAAIFGWYYWMSGDSPLTAEVGLSAGIVSSVVLTRTVSDQGLRLRRFAALGTATAAIVMISAMGLRAITDVRPAVAEIIAAEAQMSSEYDAAVRQFTKGTITTRDLTRMIDATIIPRVQHSAERFGQFADVPAEHAALLTDAQHYLRLRHESWRSRSDALRRSNSQRLKEADDKERAALRAFASVMAGAAK